ncbi:MAG: carboxypeptidase regulatory-like domain-containing protein [Vicinamibacterales bacterium]
MKGLSAGSALLIASLGSIVLAACGETASSPATAAGEQPQVSRAGGRIRGTVRLQGTPPAAAFQPVTQDNEVCGREVAVTRLSVGPQGGVRRAFVYLENAPATEPLQARASVPIEQSRCEYAPHAVQIPVGTKLEIVNGDPILHNVHARQLTANGLQTIFNIAQPVKDQRTLVDLPLTRPGIIALSCEAGHPWMTAYILVADHPFAAVTGDDGSFVIDGVPPGSYRIRMWHEGVRLTNVFPSLQRYEYEPPYEIAQEVIVPEEGDAEVNFDLELRGAPAS